MNDANYDWLIKKTLRSVDELRLWPENPRLNPEESYLTLADFAEDLTENESDKKDFYSLIKSIVIHGFVPADPVIVWKNERNGKFYVAEGNRRVLALKLLRAPLKAPKAIRPFMLGQSKKVNIDLLRKIPVNVAPSFEDAEWYINQRNSTSSLQTKWKRVPQQRWLQNLYEKYDGNFNIIESKTNLSKSELESFIRALKIRDFVKNKAVKQRLTNEEFDIVNSYRFPITILERLFNFTDTRESWGVGYDGSEILIKSNKESFYNLFAELLKRIVNNSDDRINTRINKEHLPEILESLPKVTFDADNVTENALSEEPESKPEVEIFEQDDKKNNDNSNNQSNETNYLKGNPDRSRVILEIYNLKTDNYRLNGLFDELKNIPINRYPNHVSASIRVFLDLSVLNYIQSENIQAQLCTHYKAHLRDISIKKRLEFVKANKANVKVNKILGRLLNPEQEFSLDVLNGYVHGSDVHYVNKNFVNRFWDFIFPLLEFLLDIREIKK